VQGGRRKWDSRSDYDTSSEYFLGTAAAGTPHVSHAI
jgi:hypothetical protein